MQVDSEELRQQISRLTSNELLRMLTTDRAEYRPIVINLATEELQRRPVKLPATNPNDVSGPLDQQDVVPPRQKSSVGTWIWGIWAGLFLISNLVRIISKPDFFNNLLSGLTDTFGAIPVAIVGGLLVLPLGVILFAIRERRLMEYAWLEILFGMFFGIYTIGDKTHWGGIRTTNTSDLATWMALASSVYIVVRGLDNRNKAMILKRDAREKEEKARRKLESIRHKREMERIKEGTGHESGWRPGLPVKKRTEKRTPSRLLKK